MNILPELSEGLDMLLTQLVKRYFTKCKLNIHMKTKISSYLLSLKLISIIYSFSSPPYFSELYKSSFVIEKQPPQVSVK